MSSRTKLFEGLLLVLVGLAACGGDSNRPRLDAGVDAPVVVDAAASGPADGHPDFRAVDVGVADVAAATDVAADTRPVADASDARGRGDDAADADAAAVSCSGGGAASPCDPVCQTGCSSGWRCNISGVSATCSAPPPTPARKIGDLCAFIPADTCEPGLICLPESQPICGAHCYRFCRRDADCSGGAHCSVPLSVGTAALTQFVCDVPPATCSPFKGSAVCNKGEGFGCYLAGSKYPNEVVCDCAGTLDEGSGCTVERGECKPGLICVEGGAGEAAKCRAVCPLGDPTAAQQICGAKACVPYSESTKHGFCR